MRTSPLVLPFTPMGSQVRVVAEREQTTRDHIEVRDGIAYRVTVLPPVERPDDLSHDSCHLPVDAKRIRRRVKPRVRFLR